MRLAVHVHFHVHVALQFIYSFLAASIFHFLNTAITFSCFLPTKFVSSGLYLPLFGLSLLSTSLKTLKFSRKKNLALLLTLLLFVCLFFFLALWKSGWRSLDYQLFLASIGFHVSIFYGNGGSLWIYTSNLTALKAQFHFYVGKRDILHRFACNGKPALEPEPADDHVIFVRGCPILTAVSSSSN